MYELISVEKNTCYMECPVNVGFFFSTLSYLYDEKEILVNFIDNRMIWSLP